jgi:rhomboid domain-containing protein 1
MFPGAYGAPRYGARRRGAEHPAHSLWLLVSLAQQAQQLVSRLPVTPVVTLALAAAQCALHWRGLLSPALAASLPQRRLIALCCLSPARVLRAHEWWRLAASPFLHADDLHLYYNMTSFLIKGAQLEPEMGSRAFAALLARLAIGGACIHVALASALARLSPATFGHEARLRCVRMHGCGVRGSAAQWWAR